MEHSKKMKIGLDIAILICAFFLGLGFRHLEKEWIIMRLLFAAAGVAAVVDLIFQSAIKDIRLKKKQKVSAEASMIRQLMLLDEHDKPLKSWDLAGRTAVVIGRNNEEEEVDVDLEDCEYSTFIDCQHAVLNYSLDSWYLEDLGSKNGVKVRKVEDGGCYQVMNRPCRLSAGDVIYIANTRLLLT